MSHTPPPADQPLVSIATTCRNAMPFLRECVESVLAQDWPRVELVVQDGDSGDGTTDYLASVDDRRMRWQSAPDSGTSQGVNRALSRITGDIVLLLNADDALLPGACAWAARQLAAHPGASVVYGDERVVDAAGRPLFDYRPHDYDFTRLFCVDLVPPAQAAFIRRSAFDAAGPYLDEGLQDCADYDLWLRLAAVGPLAHCEGFVTRYRWHENKSRSLDRVRLQTREKLLVQERFLSDPANAARWGHLRGRARGGLLLWASESCWTIDELDACRDYLAQALENDLPTAHFWKYFNKLVAKHPDMARVLDQAPEPVQRALRASEPAA